MRDNFRNVQLQILIYLPLFCFTIQKCKPRAFIIVLCERTLRMLSIIDKYGDRSPKLFIWAPCPQLYSLA